MGKPKDPDYWRKWRAAHPEYRKREQDRARARRANGERPDRSEEYRNRRAKMRALEAAQEALEREAIDPVLVEAREYVKGRGVQPDGRDSVTDDRYEECVAEVLLSMALGRSKRSGFERAERSRKRWAVHHLTGSDAFAALEDTRATRLLI